jgi:hypothetical protein
MSLSDQEKKDREEFWQLLYGAKDYVQFLMIGDVNKYLSKDAVVALKDWLEKAPIINIETVKN